MTINFQYSDSRAGTSRMVGEIKTDGTSVIQVSVPTIVGGTISVGVSHPESHSGLLALATAMRMLYESDGGVKEISLPPHLNFYPFEFLMLTVSPNPTSGESTLKPSIVYISGKYPTEMVRIFCELRCEDEENIPFKKPNNWEVYKTESRGGGVYFYSPPTTCSLVEAVTEFMINPRRVVL